MEFQDLLEEHGPNNLCSWAAKHGRLDVLQWARLEKGCVWDWKTCAFAALNGHLRVLKWAKENYCPLNSLACAYAAENGQLHILQWLRENGFYWNETVCTVAARHGHLNILKWAREQQPLDSKTCVYAASGGHLHIIKWVIEHEKSICVWTILDLYVKAASNGHLHILLWVTETQLKNRPFTPIVFKYNHFSTASKLLTRRVFKDQKQHRLVTKWIQSVDAHCSDLTYNDLSKLIKSFI